MAYQAYPPSYPGVPASQYSDWVTRVGAYLIDIAPPVVVWIVFFILASIIGSTVFTFLLYLVAAIGSFAYGVYNRWILGGQGQTIGKKQLGIMLVSEQTGQPIGALNAFLRDLCHIVDGAICYIGYLFPLWDAKRQTIADKIMGTVVIPSR
jgi:uncharacterized RDD family membrane protein YckC